MKNIINRTGLLHELVMISVLLICNSIYASDDTFSVNGMVFSLETTTTVYIEQLDVPENGEVVLPSEVSYNNRTFKVTGVGGEDNTLFRNPEKLIKLVIPASIKYINSDSYFGTAWQFRNCVNLKYIIIEDSEEQLGFPCNKHDSSYDTRESIFINCPLEEVYIGRNIIYGVYDRGSYKDIDTPKNYGSPFKGKQLKKVELSDKVSIIKPGLFCGCKELEEIIIPPKVVEIPTCAFSGCSSLSQIVFPDSLQSIGFYAFNYCQLKSIILPDRVEKMEDCAFKNCSELTSFTINDRLSYIAASAFMGCEKLSKIVIGKSVENIYKDAFNGASIQQIESKILEPNRCKIYDDAFSMSTYAFATLYVPQGTKEKYKEAFGWRDFYIIEEMQTNAINNINIDSAKSEIYYDINGYQTLQPHKGINIKVMSDGTSKKIFVK